MPGAQDRPEIALCRGRSDEAGRELGAELRVNLANAGARDGLRTLSAQSGAW